ncbi:hypothetical protein BOKEGFJH_00340 [Chlamydia avium]|uniref:Uncharacterized protein n=1 Tax=Chlamydia avium TaxID=1457141 RepID=A0ABP2X6T1_9CHLA|nr:hypothetical protein [Chlamydia avium]EPP36430.1 hypothetical protein CP10743SC13_0679 [Chlamydia psittaci 10_743_SC13]EPP38348.1 hypothetical protein CP10881SC42_0758 [Chlamydia avium]VVT42824.1 hypothetical protein BOKEGFJH_00340 [Chlamydia avium]
MRKRNSFLHPTETRKQETLNSVLQKTVKIVQKIAEIQDLGTKIEDNHHDCHFLKEEIDKQIHDMNKRILSMENKIRFLEKRMHGVRIGIQDLLYKINTSVDQYSYSALRSLTIEIIQKFLSLIEGVIEEDTSVNSQETYDFFSESTEDSNSSSSSYLNEICHVNKEKLNTLYKKRDSSLLKSCSSYDIDTHQNYLSSLKCPQKKSSPLHTDNSNHRNVYQDVSKYLSDNDTSINKSTFCLNKSDRLYSLGWNPLLKSSLPLDILTEGFIGFTWKAQGGKDSGKFPMSSLRYAQAQEEYSCFSIEDDILHGKYPGIYTWDCTFKALIPSIMGCKNPNIQLKVHYEYAPWNRHEQLKDTSSILSLPLFYTGSLLINQHKYDILELPPGEAKIFVVPENCKSISLHMENHQKVEGIPQDLYIMQSTYSCSWQQF